MFRLIFVLATVLVPLDAALVNFCDGVPGNLVQNCGFETGDFSSWTTGGNFDDSTFISPGVNNSGVDAVSFGAVRQPAVIYQTLTDTPGVYSVSFYLRQEFDPTSSDEYEGDIWSFTACWNNQLLLSLVNSEVSPFTLYEFTVTGNGNDTIEFEGRHDPFYWALDDVAVAGVTVDATPEPGAVSMVLGGALFMVLARTRRAC